MLKKVKKLIKKVFLVISLVSLVCSFSGQGAFASEKSEDFWRLVAYPYFKASVGDYFVVDVENGIGYLLNDSTKKLSIFPVLTGQRRDVCYLGRCYNSATPEQEWLVKEKSIQSDRITFSDSGEFFRLYQDKDEVSGDFEGRTSYGIHGYKYFQDDVDAGKKFLSMGCILVADDALDVIEASFVANENSLKVITSGDPENFVIENYILTLLQ